MKRKRWFKNKKDPKNLSKANKINLSVITKQMQHIL